MNGQLRRCIGFCLWICNYTPVLLVLVLTGLAIYSFVFVFQMETLTDPERTSGQVFGSILSILVFMSTILLMHISYFRTIFSDSSIRHNPAPQGIDTTTLALCTKCNQIRPPRAHHCSVCQTYSCLSSLSEPSDAT